MKIFDIQYKNQKVIDAYSIASEVLQSPELYERILDVKKFTYTKDTSPSIAYSLMIGVSNIVAEKLPPIPVKEWWYQSVGTIATTFAGDRSIYINSKGVPVYTLETLIKNGAHEFTHVPMGYGHGSNYNQDSIRGRMMCRLIGEFDPKSESVPHKIAQLVYRIALDKKLIK